LKSWWVATLCGVLLAAPKAGADAPPDQEPIPVPAPPADAELMELLELMVHLEMLETWDPEENLPIPVEPPGESSRPDQSGGRP